MKNTRYAIVAALLLLAQPALAEFYSATMPNAWAEAGPGVTTFGHTKAVASNGKLVPALDQLEGGCIETSMGFFAPTISVQVEGETTNTDTTNRFVRFRVKASVYPNDAWRGTMDPLGGATDCIGADNPYDCCTGAGTPTTGGLCAVGTVQSTVDIDVENVGGRANTQRQSAYSTPLAVMNVGTNAVCSGTTCDRLALRICFSRVAVTNELPAGAKFLVTKINVES